MGNPSASSVVENFSSASRVIFDAWKNSLAVFGRFNCHLIVQR